MTFCGLQESHTQSLYMRITVGSKTKPFSILDSSSYLCKFQSDFCLLSIPSNNVFCAVVLFQLNLLIHARPSTVLLHTVLAVGL